MRVSISKGSRFSESRVEPAAFSRVAVRWFVAQAGAQKRTSVNSAANRAAHGPVPTRTPLEALEDTVKEPSVTRRRAGRAAGGRGPGRGPRMQSAS